MLVPGHCWHVGKCDDCCTEPYRIEVQRQIEMLRPDLTVTYEYPQFIHMHDDDKAGYLSLAYDFTDPHVWAWQWFQDDGGTDSGDLDVPGIPPVDPRIVAVAAVAVYVEAEANFPH